MITQFTDDQWKRVYEERERWRRIGASTEPADRETAEDVVRDFYRRIGEDEPTFVWLDGPLSCCVAGALRRCADQLGEELGDQIESLLNVQPRSQLEGQLQSQLAGPLLGQLRDQLAGPLRDQLWGQLRNQLAGPLRNQLAGQLRNQLVGQLRNQLIDQLGNQLGNQLIDQLGNQLRNQLGNQLWDQLRSQFAGQLLGQLRDQLAGPLRDQLWGQLRNQLRSQLRGQLQDPLRSQLRDQLVEPLWDQLGNQLGNQLWDQLWDQLRSQFAGQLLGQLRNQLAGPLRDQLGDQFFDKIGDRFEEQLRSLFRKQLYGQEEAYWVAHYVVARDVCGVQYADEQSALLDQWVKLASSAGWWWPYCGVCFMAERPEVIRFDVEQRLHCEDGPAIRCRDGYEVYAWHGTRVPAEWIREPDKLDPQIALTWDNIEQRRAAAEIIGWGRILEVLDPVEVDRDPDPMIGTLLRVDLPDAPGEQFLRVRCGTGRDFVLPVPPEVRTALDANAWSFPGLSPKELLKLEVRT